MAVGWPSSFRRPFVCSFSSNKLDFPHFSHLRVFVLQRLVFMVIRGRPGSSFVRSFASRSLRGELWYRLVEKFRFFVWTETWMSKSIQICLVFIRALLFG
ncbi:unnamed protein product [Camellia sinensis]